MSFLIMHPPPDNQPVMWVFSTCLFHPDMSTARGKSDHPVGCGRHSSEKRHLSIKPLDEPAPDDSIETALAIRTWPNASAQLSWPAG